MFTALDAQLPETDGDVVDRPCKFLMRDIPPRLLVFVPHCCTLAAVAVDRTEKELCQRRWSFHETHSPVCAGQGNVTTNLTGEPGTESAAAVTATAWTTALSGRVPPDTC